MIDHAAIVQGMAAGVGGAVLSLLGVDAGQLTCALIGAVLGARYGGEISSRWASVCIFVAAVCAAAITASGLGSMLSGWLPSINPAMASKLIALGVGVFLHPLIQAATQQAIPALAERAAEKIRGKA